MALLNLLQLNSSDDQQTFIDKTNWNFDSILSMGGGPPGLQGTIGIQGIPGSQGVQGIMGLNGLDGTYWFVMPSLLNPFSPVPKLGDKWLQTDTFKIFEFGTPISGVWNNTTYSLITADVFEQGGTNNIVFTHPSNAGSLVLSSILYGPGHDSLPGGVPAISPYKLKLVGPPGQSLIKFGIDLPGENAEGHQPSISLQALYGNFDWTFDNGSTINYGAIYFKAHGNSIRINSVPIGGFAVTQFNGTQAQLQMNATDKLMSFSSLSAGNVQFHIGRDGGILTAADRLFSVADDGNVQIGNAWDLPAGVNQIPVLVTPYSSGTSGWRLDIQGSGGIGNAGGHLSTTASSGVSDGDTWLRMHGFNAAQDILQIRNLRSFNDGSSRAMSAEVRIEKMHTISHAVNAEHFISFHGGAKDYATGGPQPTLRFGYGHTPNDGYYFGGTWNNAPDPTSSDGWNNFALNGHIGIGTSAFIKEHNDPITPANNFRAALNIESYQTENLLVSSPYYTLEPMVPGGGGSPDPGFSATNLQSGIHLSPINAPPTILGAAFTGITAGGSNDGAGNDFRQGSYAGVLFPSTNLAGVGGTGVILATSDYTTAPIGMKARMSISDSGVVNWYATDYSLTPPSHVLKMVVLGSTTTFDEEWSPSGPGVVSTIWNGSTGTTDGFFGIGTMSSPQTKFQINGAATVGTRKVITTYATEVGDSSFTSGRGHKAAGIASAVIGGGHGGTSHTIAVSCDNSVIIGHNGANGMTLTGTGMANKVAIPTQTFITSADSGAPTVYPYFTSINAAYPNPNELGIYVGGLAGGDINGIEILIDGDNINGGAPILISRGFISPFASSTSFVVEQDGRTGIGGNLFTATPGTQWNDSGGNNAMVHIHGDIVIGANSPTISPGAVTAAYSRHISTTAESNATANILQGNHLYVSVGLTQNTHNLGTSGTTGGDLTLTAGDADNTTGGGASTGGKIIISAGNATGNTTQIGGEVIIHGGGGATGGHTYVWGGLGGTTGGDISIFGGLSFGATGGNVIIQGGSASTTGGDVTISGGSGATKSGQIIITSGLVLPTTANPGMPYQMTNQDCIVVTSALTATLTLPDVSKCQNGMIVAIRNTSTTALTINVFNAGVDVIRRLATVSNVTTISLAADASVQLVLTPVGAWIEY